MALGLTAPRPALGGTSGLPDGSLQDRMCQEAGETCCPGPLDGEAPGPGWQRSRFWTRQSWSSPVDGLGRPLPWVTTRRLPGSRCWRTLSAKVLGPLGTVPRGEDSAPADPALSPPQLCPLISTLVNGLSVDLVQSLLCESRPGGSFQGQASPLAHPRHICWGLWGSRRTSVLSEAWGCSSAL